MACLHWKRSGVFSRFLRLSGGFGMAVAVNLRRLEWTGQLDCLTAYQGFLCALRVIREQSGVFLEFQELSRGSGELSG